MLKLDPIPACAGDCTALNWSGTALPWCSYEVRKPHTEWETVDARAGLQADSDRRAATALEQVDVLIVQEPEDVAPAMAELYDSMKDYVIGIDLEWKPDDRTADNDVAMVQLASSSLVVLLRTCKLKGLPREVVDFCKDDSVVGVGFSWGAGDEKKMRDSFRLGCRDLFTHFVDVRTQAEVLGYHGFSVGSLAKQVLGFQPPVSKQVTISNWEAFYLSTRQLRYAALDALVTGDIFRGLRALHASQHACQGCALPLGSWPGVLDLQCQHQDCICKKPFASIQALLDHMREKGHASNVVRCVVCGRAASREGGGTRKVAPHWGGRGHPAAVQTGLPASSHRSYALEVAVPLAEEEHGFEMSRQADDTFPGRPQGQYCAGAKGRRRKSGPNQRDHRVYSAYNAYC